MREQLHLEAPWEEVKERLKEINTELTDEDLYYDPGNEDVLLSRLSEIMHQPRENIRNLIESISTNKGKAS